MSSLAQAASEPLKLAPTCNVLGAHMQGRIRAL
jgi:hypothetical protein